MSLRTGTICSKHEAIRELADKLAGIANEIDQHASNCLDDGQRMEAGLDKKGERIQELEGQVEDLEKANRALERERDELAETVAELKQQIASMEAEAA